MDFVPAPLYPPLLNRPLTLTKNDENNYMVKVRQSLKSSMKDSFYYVTSKETEKSNFNSSIERYSDKYSKHKNESIEWATNWMFLPKELRFFYEKEAKKDLKAAKKRKISKGKAEKEGAKVAKKVDLSKIIDQNRLQKELITEEPEEMEEGEEVAEEKEEKSEKGEGEEDETENENEEGAEDEEEENDYIDDYFDNGENYGDDDIGGDDDDGPVY